MNVLMRNRIVLFLPLFLFFASGVRANNENIGLLAAIDIALAQSDFAHDLQEDIVLSKMGVAAAEHRFDTKLVPLSNIGYTQGTGSQQLGMEFRKELKTGASISYGVVGDRIDDNSGYVVENPTSAKAYVRISQGLFRRWGVKYNLVNLSAAELRDKEKAIHAERSKQTFVLNVVQKYYDVVQAKQLLKKTEKALERSREHLDSAKARQAVGLVSKVDVYRAELAALDAESMLQNQQRQKRKAVDSFRELLRLSEDTLFSVSGMIVQMTPVVSESWEEDLFKTRLDWQAHRVRAELNKLEIYKAQQDLTPDVGLSFTLERKGEGESIEEAVTLDQTNWSIQLEMLSSLDTFNEESVLIRKKIDKAKLRRSKEALSRQIKREVSEAFQDLIAEENDYQISIKRLKQAEMALDLAVTRYEKGLSDNLDVLDAETAYSEAGFGISRSLTGYNLASVSLAYKLGVLDRQWIEMSLKSTNAVNRK